MLTTAYSLAIIVACAFVGTSAQSANPAQNPHQPPPRTPHKLQRPTSPQQAADSTEPAGFRADMALGPAKKHLTQRPTANFTKFYVRDNMPARCVPRRFPSARSAHRALRRSCIQFRKDPVGLISWGVANSLLLDFLAYLVRPLQASFCSLNASGVYSPAD